MKRKIGNETFHYKKDWFPTEKEAKEFASKCNGEVYNADFYGGYEVIYPVENDDKIRGKRAELIDWTDLNCIVDNEALDEVLKPFINK